MKDPFCIIQLLYSLLLIVQTSISTEAFVIHSSLFRGRISLRESTLDEPQKEFFEPKSGLRPLDPSELEIILDCERQVRSSESDVPCNVNNAPQKRQTIFPFVNMIRVAGNYIANHRNTLSVLHIPGHLLEWDGFPSLMEDIALTWLLGMKIVIVVGCRYQVNLRLAKLKKTENEAHGFSLRVTDHETMRIIEEEAGVVRFEVERQLNRCLKLHGGADLSVPGALNANVVSGNFYIAERIGLVNGIDYQFSGVPTKVNTKKINSIYEKNDIVLLTSCATSPFGESLNVNSECLTVHLASTLGANKVIFCSDTGMILRNKQTGESIQNFRLRDAKTFLNYQTAKIHQDFFPSINSPKEYMSSDALDMLLKIAWCSVALEKGTERAHIVAPSDGAFLTELFTAKEGSATCISRDEVEEIHPDENFFGSDVTNGWIESLNQTNPGRWFD